MNGTARGLRGLGMALGVVALGFGAWGCSGDDANGGVTTPGADTDLAFESGPPTLAEIRARVEMTDPQSMEIEPPLGTWRRDHASRLESVQRGSIDRSDLGEPPMLKFIEESAAILDRPQLAGLVTMLAERHEAVLARQAERFENGSSEGQRGRGPFGRHGGPGHGRHGGRGDGGFFEDLDLSPEQVVALRASMKTYHEARKTLLESYRDGTISALDLRTGLKESRSAHEAALDAALDDDQLAKLSERRTAMEQKMAERRLERLDETLGRRIEFLTKVLGLSEAQIVGVTEVLENANAEEKALLEAILAGGVDPDDAFVDGLLIRESARAGILALLDAEQAAIFEALRPLMGKGPGQHH